MLPTGGGKIFGPKKFSGVGENFFANLGVGDGLFEPKGGVKRILLKGELKIFQQRGAKLPLGHTLNWGVQMKKISFGGGQKKFLLWHPKYLSTYGSHHIGCCFEQVIILKKHEND